MPNGDTVVRSGAAQCQRGFTYLLLLFMMAVVGAGFATVGEQWAIAGQREREAELLFRGAQFSQALASWRDAARAGQPMAPLSLQDLLVDVRDSPPRHHLRRLFTDPFTGQADWDLLLDAQGRVTAVASRSRQPALRRVAVSLRDGADDQSPAVGDWLFTAASPVAQDIRGQKGAP